MDNEQNDIDIIDESDTKEMVERQIASNLLIRLSYLFIALSIVYAVHSIGSIFKYATDNSVPLVNCPLAYELDAPVLMKPLRDENPKAKDRWIRGFIRRYIQSQFPRNSEDFTAFTTYVANHSKYAVKDKYESLLIDKEQIMKFIEAQFFYKFYPKFGLGDGSDIRIRANDIPDQYVVEVDGYLIKRMNKIQERFTPTLRYVVEMGKPTLQNPEGIYVVDANIEQITDYVSGTKENL